MSYENGNLSAEVGDGLDQQDPFDQPERRIPETLEPQQDPFDNPERRIAETLESNEERIMAAEPIENRRSQVYADFSQLHKPRFEPVDDSGCYEFIAEYFRDGTHYVYKVPMHNMFGMEGDTIVLGGTGLSGYRHTFDLNGHQLYVNVYLDGSDEPITRIFDFRQLVRLDLHTLLLQAEHIGEIEGLEGQLEAVRRQRDRARAALSDHKLDDRIKDAFEAENWRTEELEDMKREAKLRQTEIELQEEKDKERPHQQRIIELGEQLASLRNHRSHIWDTIGIREGQLIADRQIVIQHHQQINEREVTIQQLANECATYQLELSDTQLRLVELEKERLDWELKYKNQATSANEREAEIDVMRARINELEIQKAELDSQFTDISTRFEIELFGYEETKAENFSLQASLTAVRLENSKLKVENTTLSKDLVLVRESLRSSQESIERLERLLFAANGSIEKLTLDRNRQEEEIQRLTAELETAKGEVSKFKQECMTLKVAVKVLTAEKATLEVNFRSINHQLHARTKELAESRDQCRTYEAEVLRLNAQLVKVTAELTEIRKTMKAEQLKTKGLSERLCKLRDCLAIHVDQVTVIDRELTSDVSLSRRISHMHAHHVHGVRPSGSRVTSFSNGLNGSTSSAYRSPSIKGLDIRLNGVADRSPVFNAAPFTRVSGVADPSPVFNAAGLTLVDGPGVERELPVLDSQLNGFNPGSFGGAAATLMQEVEV